MRAGAVHLLQNCWLGFNSRGLRDKIYMIHVAGDAGRRRAYTVIYLCAGHAFSSAWLMIVTLNVKVGQLLIGEIGRSSNPTILSGILAIASLHSVVAHALISGVGIASTTRAQAGGRTPGFSPRRNKCTTRQSVSQSVSQSMRIMPYIHMRALMERAGAL